MAPRRVWVGLGANLGSREETLLEVARRLAALPGVRLMRLSSLFETAPWGRTDQPWFVNAVAEIETTLRPVELLERLFDLERAMGRVRSERWGPRLIDLDYLLDEHGPVDEPPLHVPHRELENRAFVLAPLAELRPDLVLPSGRPIAERCAELLPDQPLRRLSAIPTMPGCPPPSSR